MDTQKVITALNKAVSLEHAATLQYQQHALLVSGLWRKVYSDFFAGQSQTSLSHAHKFGQKIVALGGVPTVEIGATVHQSTDLEEMLHQDLALEKEALAAYLEAHSLAESDVALRNMLETQIEDEQNDIEELEMYLGLIKTQGVEPDIKLRRVK